MFSWASNQHSYNMWEPHPPRPTNIPRYPAVSFKGRAAFNFGPEFKHDPPKFSLSEGNQGLDLQGLLGDCLLFSPFLIGKMVTNRFRGTVLTNKSGRWYHNITKKNVLVDGQQQRVLVACWEVLARTVQKSRDFVVFQYARIQSKGKLEGRTWRMAHIENHDQYPLATTRWKAQKF